MLVYNFLLSGKKNKKKKNFGQKKSEILNLS